MFWDKKEKSNGLPDLPPLKLPSQSQPEEEEEKDEEMPEPHGLPSFPDSPTQKGFAQTAIKDAISSTSKEDEQEHASPVADDGDKTFKTVEMEEWSPQSRQSDKPAESQMPVIPKKDLSQHRMSTPQLSAAPVRQQKNTDVFVKIDKFYSARRALEMAHAKLHEIDEVLHKIRETKLREEQELDAWEKDIATIKARLKDVTENIFEKIE